MKPDLRSMKPERPYLFFAIILLIHLVYFLFALIRPPDPLPDTADYLNASNHLYSQGVLYCGDLSEPIREELFTRRPPLYPLLLGIHFLTGSQALVYLFQIALSLISIFLVIRIFRPDSTDRQPLYFAIALVLLLATPAQFIYSSRIMAEIPFQLMIVLSAWSLHTYFHSRQKKYIWFFQLSLTLAMATKPVLYPFAAVMVFFSLYMSLVTRKLIWVLTLSIPLVWITGYRTWNYHRTGSTQYASIQTANLVNYNLYYYIMNREGSGAAAEKVDSLYARCGEADSYREKNLCLEYGAREIILNEPLKYALFHLKGSVRLFIDPGRFDLVTFFGTGERRGPGFLKEMNRDGLRGAFRFLGQQGPVLMTLLLVLALLKVVKLAGFVIYLFRRDESLYLRIFLLLLIGYLAAVTGPLGASRFLLPVELLLIGCAVKGWTAILKPTSPGSGTVRPDPEKG